MAAKPGMSGAPGTASSEVAYHTLGASAAYPIDPFLTFVLFIIDATVGGVKEA